MNTVSEQVAEVTRWGLFDMQVCVPRDWSDEQVIEFAESRYPSGTNGWTIRRQGDKLLAGANERVDCAIHVGFVHIMLDAFMDDIRIWG